MASGQFHLTLNKAEPRLHNNEKFRDNQDLRYSANFMHFFSRWLRHDKRKKRAEWR